MAYFRRLDARHFTPTELVGGAWNVTEQHVAPAIGLLAHAIEVDAKARRPDPLQLGRLSYDILGTIPLDTVEIDVTGEGEGTSELGRDVATEHPFFDRRRDRL